jgi:hypothetical protein
MSGGMSGGTSGDVSGGTSTAVDPADPVASPRPRAATDRGHLLRAELGRLRRRRLVIAFVVLAVLALLAAMALVFATHDQDISGARAEAMQRAQRDLAANQEYRTQCLADPTIPDADKQNGACGPEEQSVDDFVYVEDPRFVAATGLPAIAIGVAVVGALLGAMIGATAVGADWSSRAMVTLITWEPRRLRLFGTRLLAISLFVAGVAVVTQAIALGLGALTVSLRGTWTSPPLDPNGWGIPEQHFWRDLLSLQARGVLVVVLAAVLAASIAMLTRHTAGLLGVLLGWFVVVENAVRALFYDRGWPRWLVIENITAFLVPRGQRFQFGETFDRGQYVPRVVHVSNLEALLYLGLVTAVFVVIAGALLRRRDL